MQGEGESWPAPTKRFAELFRDLVDFRGHEAEANLHRLLGQERVRALYEGAEPSFSEFVAVARTLNVPLNAFAGFETGHAPEIELVIAEILYFSAGLPEERRKSFAEALLHAMRDYADLPPSSVTLLELIDKANNA